MLSSIFRYTSYMILVFGFFYMSWHFGRAYEKETFDHVAVVNASEQATDCKEVRQEADVLVDGFAIPEGCLMAPIVVGA